MSRAHSRDHREPRYTVRLSRRSGEWVARRARRSESGSVAQQIAVDVATLADILAGEARRLPLTLAEARLLREVVAPGLVAPGAGRVLLGALIDAIDIAREAGPDLSAPHDVDAEELTRKVRALGHAGDLAVREALAEWHAAGLPDTVAGYRERGPQRRRAGRRGRGRRVSAAALGAVVPALARGPRSPTARRGPYTLRAVSATWRHTIFDLAAELPGHDDIVIARAPVARVRARPQPGARPSRAR